jgi:hypothetical protein
MDPAAWKTTGNVLHHTLHVLHHTRPETAAGGRPQWTLRPGKRLAMFCTTPCMFRTTPAPKQPQVGDHKDQIGVVSTEATQEAGLEGMLERIHDKWKHIEFAVTPFKEYKVGAEKKID